MGCLFYWSPAAATVVLGQHGTVKLLALYSHVVKVLFVWDSALHHGMIGVL
jgi:hypothetical protein